MSTVRIAVVGLGDRGLHAAAILAQRGALAALCDADPVTLVEATGPGLDVRRTADYLALLASPEIDAVVLCTPPGAWDGMVETALMAGKDVCLDGPLLLAPGRALALLKTVVERRRILLASAPLRFAEPTRALLVAVRAGRLGKLHHLDARTTVSMSPDEAPTAGAGLSATTAALMLELLDAPPSSVFTRATTWRSAHIPDVTECLFEARDAARAVLVTSHLAALGSQPPFELVVRGERGGARLFTHGDGGDDLSLVFDLEATDDEARQVGPRDADPAAARAAMIEHFVEAVTTRRPPLGGPESLLGLATFLAAAQRSLDEGRPVDPSGGPSAVAAPVTNRHPGLHATVEVDGPCEIGEGTRVWHFSKLLGPLKIGKGCSFGQNVVIERHVEIGDNVKVQNNVSIYSGVILEDDVFCGPSMVFTNIGTPRSHFPRKGQYATTRVRRGASIGANATVVCGHTLGQYCFVGAGAVVTRDVPDYALVYGNPARVMGFTCYCGARLALGTAPDTSEAAACGDCGRHYAREGLSVSEVGQGGPVP